MPIHVENMTSDVTVFDGDVPLSAQQLEAITAGVAERMARQQRDGAWRRDATVVRRSVIPPLEVRGD
jgi:hypothetical protein